MAFTDDEISRLRTLLGYSDHKANLSPFTVALGVISTSGETQLRKYLTQLESLEDSIAASWNCWKLVKADSATFNHIEARDAMWQEGRRIIGNISTLVGLKIRADYFDPDPGSGCYTGYC